MKIFKVLKTAQMPLVGWAVVALLIMSAGVIEAHHSLTQIETDTAVTIKGTITRFERVNPHSYLYVDQETADGRVEQWAVEGPSEFQLNRRGLGRDVLKAGETIKACGYVLKVDGQAPRGVTSRLLVAERLVMPDGERRTWSDYGHHHCLEPGESDSHSR